MAVIQTFANLYGAVLAWLDESDNTDTTLTLVKAAINEALQFRCDADRWPFLLWPSTETISVSAAAGQLYPLHALASKVEFVYDASRRVPLIEVPSRQLTTAGGVNPAAALPEQYRLVGSSPVASQPVTPSTLSLVSSSTSDITASIDLSWRVMGIVNGAYTEERLNPNGTTPVTSTNTFSKVLAVTKMADWDGTGTLTANSGATTLLTLGPTEYGRQYPQIELLAPVSATTTLTYRFYRKPLILERANDIPDIPAPYSQVLIWDALLLIAAYNTDTSPAKIAIWRDRQDKWEAAMHQAFLEGQTLDASLRRIRYNNDEAAVARLFPTS